MEDNLLGNDSFVEPSPQQQLNAGSHSINQENVNYTNAECKSESDRSRTMPMVINSRSGSPQIQYTKQSNTDTMNNLTMSKLPTVDMFDELEYLHDFLEADARKPWFEANCFVCNCRNVFLSFLFLIVIGSCIFITYHFYWDSYIKSNLRQVIQWATIPIIAIMFTYAHIALALWMTFWPTEFFGIWQFKSGIFKGYGFGWQGIVPMKAIKMATIAVDLMVPDVVRMEDVVAKIDPKIVSEIMEPACMRVFELIIPKVAMLQAPMAYSLLPAAMKQMLVDVAMQEAPQTVKNMINDINENIEEIFDLKGMVSNALQSDKALLNYVFLKCGRKELIFIRNFGAFLGLVFGTMQMFATIYFNDNKYFRMLCLPISGFILGWITNWIALQLIFRPINPIHVNPFCCFFKQKCQCTIQGLFLKRQKEVSVEFAAFISKTILRADLILAEFYRGPSSNRVFEKVTRHLNEACDRFAGYGKTKQLIEFAIGSERFEQVKNQVIDEMLHCHELDCQEEIIKVQKKLEEYTDDVMDLERTLRTKMAALPVEQFEGVLHPIFEEDEIKLIVIGALLGLLVGIFQVTVIGN